MQNHHTLQITTPVSFGLFANPAWIKQKAIIVKIRLLRELMVLGQGHRYMVCAT